MKRWFFGLNKVLRWLLVVVAIFIFLYIVKIVFFPTKEESPYITTKPVIMDLENVVLATGIVNPYKQVNVGAQVSGQIESLNAKVGQKVKKGDTLAVIDAQTQQNSYLSAKAQMFSDKAALLKAKIEYDRQAKMIKSGATSQADYDNAKASLALASASFEQSKLKVDTAKVSLGYTKVVAPIDGVVVSIAVDQGQTVNANQTTPTILILAQMDKMTILSEVSEADVSKLKIGMQATFTTLGDNEHHYTTVLRSIDPSPTILVNNSNTNINSATDNAIYYYATMDIPNSDERLKIGMTAQISIVTDNVRGVLTIPSVALGEQNDKGLYAVKILDKKSNPMTKYVKVGLNNSVNAQVISGIDKNDDVIISQETSIGAQSSTNSKSSAMSRRRMPMGM